MTKKYCSLTIQSDKKTDRGIRFRLNTQYLEIFSKKGKQAVFVNPSTYRIQRTLNKRKELIIHKKEQYLSEKSNSELTLQQDLLTTTLMETHNILPTSINSEVYNFQLPLITRTIQPISSWH